MTIGAQRRYKAEPPQINLIKPIRAGWMPKTNPKGMGEIKMKEFNGMKIVYTYTTKDAVADGSLVLVAESQSREAGIKFPVYMTRSVWDKYVEVPKRMEGEQDLQGRLWDILWMFMWAAKTNSSSLMMFKFICRIPDNDDWEENEKMEVDRLMRTITLKSVIEPQDIDDPSPAIFIMKPWEY